MSKPKREDVLYARQSALDSLQNGIKALCKSLMAISFIIGLLASGLFYATVFIHAISSGITSIFFWLTWHGIAVYLILFFLALEDVEDNES